MQQVCRHYGTAKGCKRGDRCKFLHPPGTPALAPAACSPAVEADAASHTTSVSDDSTAPASRSSSLSSTARRLPDLEPVPTAAAGGGVPEMLSPRSSEDALNPIFADQTQGMRLIQHHEEAVRFHQQAARAAHMEMARWHWYLATGQHPAV